MQLLFPNREFWVFYHALGKCRLIRHKAMVFVMVTSSGGIRLLIPHPRYKIISISRTVCKVERVKKLLIIPALMLITGCASVSKVEVNPNVSFNHQEFKQAEKRINKEQFEADVSGKTGLKIALVSGTSGFVGGFAGATGGFVSSQAFGYAISSFAGKEYSEIIPKNSWIVDRILYRKRLLENSNFEVILVYPNEKRKEELNGNKFLLFKGMKIGFKSLFGSKYSDTYGIKLVPSSKNKIIVYILDGKPLLYGNWNKYPWIRAMAEVYVGKELIGRYLLYGVAWREDGGYITSKDGAIPELYRRITEDFLKNSTVASK